MLKTTTSTPHPPMRRHMNFVNSLTKIMGQTLYKIPIWRFCIYSLERLILHPQYHHTSFLLFFWQWRKTDQFLIFDENHLLTPLQKTHYGDFVKTMSLWPAEDCFHAVSCTCISPNIISKPILSKNEEWENFQFFFFFTMATLQKRYVYGLKGNA